jgi:hypothetical protein
MKNTWGCPNCEFTTETGQVGICPYCRCDVLVIPQNMDNDLFKAIVAVVDGYYELEVILTRQESAVELWSTSDGAFVRTIKNWEDFKYFFGMYFYRMFKEVE